MLWMSILLPCTIAQNDVHYAVILGKKQHTIRHGIAMARLQPLLHHLAPTMTRLLASLLATAAIHTRGGVTESQQV